MESASWSCRRSTQVLRSMSRRRPAFHHTAVPWGPFLPTARRSASWPCQALRSGFAQQIAQALDVLPGHRGRHDVARRLGRWRSRRRWCWRCRAGLLGPRIELAAHGALDDAEQVPGGVADAMLAAPCGTRPAQPAAGQRPLAATPSWRRLAVPPSVPRNAWAIAGRPARAPAR